MSKPNYTFLKLGTTIDDINRRNNLLKAFFSSIERNIIVLVKNINIPCIIVDYAVVLSAYVKNFDLIFTDKPFNGEEVLKFKLTPNSRLSDIELDAILEKYEHRSVYRVKQPESNLFLVGYNFKDKEINTADNRYPVFAKFGMKIYFDKEYAVSISDAYKDYNLEVTTENLELDPKNS